MPLCSRRCCVIFLFVFRTDFTFESFNERRLQHRDPLSFSNPKFHEIPSKNPARVAMIPLAKAAIFHPASPSHISFICNWVSILSIKAPSLRVLHLDRPEPSASLPLNLQILGSECSITRGIHVECGNKKLSTTF
jgi:hypothetical protein